MRIVLTIIALALVATLSVALVGPLLIDWSAHRDEIAARLGALAGADVKLEGPVTLRLLPTPYLEVGAGSAVVKGPGAPRLSFESARIELALVKLASGAIRFTEVDLEKPVLTLTRSPDGAPSLPALPGAEADTVGFDRLVVRNGRLMIEGAGTSRAFGDIQLTADAPSLSGPVHVTGQFGVPNGPSVAFRLATEKAGPTGAPTRLSIDPGPGWPALEFDGAASAAGAHGVNLSGVAKLIGAAPGPDGPTPWRIVGPMTADLDRATLAGAEFRFGSEERAVRARRRPEFVVCECAAARRARQDETGQSRCALSSKGRGRRPPGSRSRGDCRGARALDGEGWRAGDRREPDGGCGHSRIRHDFQSFGRSEDGAGRATAYAHRRRPARPNPPRGRRRLGGGARGQVRGKPRFRELKPRRAQHLGEPGRAGLGGEDRQPRASNSFPRVLRQGRRRRLGGRSLRAQARYWARPVDADRLGDVHEPGRRRSGSALSRSCERFARHRRGARRPGDGVIVERPRLVGCARRENAARRACR